MADTDTLGAKASNAGDDFHVLWALIHSIKVLDPASKLSAVTVEGFPLASTPKAGEGAWDGVDVGLFYGGESLSTATRVEIQQLKYSTTSPKAAWTIARLCHSTRKTGNNSVIAKMAKAYVEALQIAPQLRPSDVTVKLVSNQPVHGKVIESLAMLQSPNAISKRGTEAEKNWKLLKQASGLTPRNFQNFANSLDFTECQSPSRFEMHLRVGEAISRIAASDSRQAMFELRNIVYTRMLPGDSSPITREVILGAMFVGDIHALLPCPSQIKRVDQLVPREGVRKLAEELNSHQKICLHGEGGSGKTTALQDLERRLPSGSEMIVFDCYGAGRYLDSDGQRHLARHALLHLCNELSARVGAPMLVAASSSVDHIREFSSRLRMAADIIRSKAPDALLVITIDAADNSVTAAQTRIPQERSFVHDIAELGEVPSNVRIVISARTGRFTALRLPESFKSIPLENFTLPEAREFVQLRWKSAPSTWVEDLNFLSGGNPRVISYAFDYAGKQPKKALAYLKPSGKELKLIFEERIKEALTKGGDVLEFNNLCAGLVAFARPIPINHLAAVLNVSDAHVRDLSGDLSPGLLKDGNFLVFADEDFEDYISKRAESSLSKVRTAVSEHLQALHQGDEYCAEHVAAAVLEANDGPGLLRLAQMHPEPKAIRDPVKRREVQLHRLKLAMRVARQAGQRADAILVLLRGAHALRTDAAVRKMLTDNIDLSARFAQQSLRKAVLFDKNLVGLQGRTLCHLMLDSASSGDSVRARDWGRQFSAWVETYFRRRTDEPAIIDKWKLDDTDIAAEGEAVLRSEGAVHGVATIRRWKPKTLMPKVIRLITRRLLASGQHALLEEVLAVLPNGPIWDVLLRVPLLLAGREVDVDLLQRNIGRWEKRGWIGRDLTHRDLDQSGEKAYLLGLMLTGCEIVAARKGMGPEVRRILDILANPTWRTREILYPGSCELIDASMRAHALLESSEGREATLDSYLGPEKPKVEEHEKLDRTAKNHLAERAERLEKFVKRLLPVYNARAACLLPSTTRTELLDRLRGSIKTYSVGDYGMRDEQEAKVMRDRIGQSIAAMQHLPNFGGLDCAELAYGSRDSNGYLSAMELSTLGALSLHPKTHTLLLEKVTAHASAVLADKAPATDRADRLVDLARLLSTFSPADSKSLFASASAVLEDVDFDSISHLEMLKPFAKSAAKVLGCAQSQVVACQVADFATDIWTVLGDHERFPWESLARTLATLDMRVAFSAATRWDDSGVVHIQRLIPEILDEGLEALSISAALAVPLLCLGVDIDSNVLDPIAKRLAVGEPLPSRLAICEELARMTLLNLDSDRGISEVRMAVDMSMPAHSTPWIDRGREVLQFIDSRSELDGVGQIDTPSLDDDDTESNVTQFLPQGIRYVVREEIEETVNRVIEDARKRESYIGISGVLEKIRHEVQAMDRRAHIEALVECEIFHGKRDLADAIASAVKEWRAVSPSVAGWCEDELPSLITERLPSFFRVRYGWDISPFSEMLTASGLQGDQISEALLEGLELHANVWDAASVYGILELVAIFIPAHQASEVLIRHLAQETSTLKYDQVGFDITDAPVSLEKSVGRMLYALLGDADIRIRWKAAHALRVASRVGQDDVVDAVIEQWPRRIELSFRDPLAPFYWLSARLWLLVSLQRIAQETPRGLAKHGQFLLTVATDADFPHVLCRSFAKGAVEALVASGHLKIDPAQARALDLVNKSAIPTKTSERAAGFGRFAEMDKRRFRFDSMDTLPYWYDEPLQLFAGVTGSEFLDVAEQWILDKWQASTDHWMWANEPRKHRFAREPLSSSNRQGSLPTIERAHTHLEWHALWCTVGELLLTRPLLRRPENDWGGLEYWLSRKGLTQPPYWLADLRSTKPLETRLWYSENEEDSNWLSGVSAEDLLVEIGLGESHGDVIVASYVSGSKGKQRWTMNVSSALVSSETAPALLRALQSIDNAWDYKIPDEGDHLEIDADPYRLVGWLSYPERDGKLDDDDILRRHVGAIVAKPGVKVSKTLKLQNECDDSGCWIDPDGAISFRYVAWSDDISDEASRYPSGFRRSYGHRLLASRAAIQDFLTAQGMDLIIEVDLTRRTGDSYGGDDSKDPKEAQYDFIVILRKDGTIESADGGLGAWAVSSPRAQSPGRRRYARPLDGASSGRTVGKSKKR